MIYLGTSKVVTSNNDIEVNRRSRRVSVVPNYNYNIGDIVRVSCYTNCEETELFLNGKSLGKKKLKNASGRVITWDFPFEAGTIVAKAFNKGTEVGK